MLDRAQFHALGRAHALEGGGPVYATAMPNYKLDHSVGVNGCYEINFDEPETYFADGFGWFGYSENLIVPLSGGWGVLVAEHFHAVVAGSSSFVETLLGLVTLSPDEMALILVRRWKELGEIGLPSPWLARLLERIYGAEEAASFKSEGST